MKRAISNIISSIVNSELLSSELAIGDVPVTLRRSPRARRLRLRIDPRTRALLLTVPPRVSQRRAMAWAREQREWVERALDALPAGIPILPGTEIPYRGAPHRVDWSPERPRRIARGDGILVAGGPIDMLAPRVLRWLRSEALSLLADETHALAGRIDVMAPKIAVGDPVSRWGSCSSGGTIRYSWRLVMAPDFVRRATVAHEVAHLVHMHHGPDFHALVAELFGADPRPARLWLRREGAGLHGVGRN